MRSLRSGDVASEEIQSQLQLLVVQDVIPGDILLKHPVDRGRFQTASIDNDLDEEKPACTGTMFLELQETSIQFLA